MTVFEVPVIVGIVADSREEAESLAGDLADSLADVYGSVESATALTLTNDDHFAMLGIDRNGIEQS